MRCTIGALVVFWLLPIFAIQGQELRIKPGDRVRVTAPECELEEAVGTVVSIEKERFTANVEDRDIRCPFHALTQLDVSVGERKWWKPALVGAGLGVGIGTLGAWLIWQEEWSENNWNPPFAQAVMFTLATITIGTVTGSEIGRRPGKDQWEEVRLPMMLSSPLFLGDGRLGIRFEIPIRE